MNKIKNITLAETAKITKLLPFCLHRKQKLVLLTVLPRFGQTLKGQKKPLSEQRSVIYSIPRTNVGRYFCAVAQNL